MSSCDLSGILPKKYGYFGIKAPKEGIDPLLVFCRKNKYSYIKELDQVGNLLNLVDSNAEIPLIIKDRNVADFEYVETNKFDINFGISFLEKLLQALKIPSGLDIGAHLKAGYKHASGIIIKFKNLKYDNMDIIKLGDYLSKSKVNKNNPSISLFNEPYEGYLIYETLKSNCFNIKALKNDNTAVDFDISFLKDALEANTDVNVIKESDLSITYNGQIFLTAGFKAYYLWYNETNDKLELQQIDNNNPVVMKSNRVQGMDEILDLNL